MRIGGTSTLWGNSASTAGGEEACLSGTRVQAGAVLKMGAQYTDAFSMRPVDDQAYPFISDSRILQGSVGPTTVSGGGTSYVRKATSATYPEGVFQPFHHPRPLAACIFFPGAVYTMGCDTTVEGEASFEFNSAGTFGGKVGSFFRF